MSAAEEIKKRAVVIGGGASGMMCSIFLARRGFETFLFEHNEKLGKKIFITGKGRCNLSNECSDDVFFDSVKRNSRFLYSSYSSFSSSDTVDFFNSIGLKTKTERGNRIFPVSDKAYEVTDVLKKEMLKQGVRIFLNTEVNSIITDDGSVIGVKVTENYGKGSAEIMCDRVIVATGGSSYPSTGSTGDGYRFAAEAGLKVTERYPSLVSFVTAEDFPSDIAGLTLKNISLNVKDSENRSLFRDTGELLFTHKGISGPLVLRASSVISGRDDIKDLKCHIDLKPAVTSEQFDKRLIRVFGENPNKDIVNALKGVYPSALLPVILDMAGIDIHTKVNCITKKERRSIVTATKDLCLILRGTGGFDEAVITRGGVDIKEIDPSTMESKKIKGLYFIGEVLDVDALTGGFNLQIAWTTAYAAGNS